MNITIPVILAALLCTAPAYSQIAGFVATSDDVPIANAAVELRAPGQRIARVATGVDGRFAFSQADAMHATAIVVEHVGYRTQVKSLARAANPLRIVLEPEPVELEALVVAPSRLCPNKADPRAERAWRAFAAHYSRLPSPVFISTGLYQYSDIVSAERLGTFDTGESPFAIRGKRKLGSTDLDFLRDGYARAMGTTFSSEEFDSWEYARLGSLDADHFIDEAFAKSHVLSLGDARPDGSFDVQFCPKQRKKPDVEGTLALTADHLLYEARWEFRVPRNEEFAGGTAIFAPPNPDAPPTFLLPASSTFWRQHRISGQYFQQMEKYGIWAVGNNAAQRKLVQDWKLKFEGN